MSDIPVGLDAATVHEARRISQRLKPSRKWVPLKCDGDNGVDGALLYSNNVYNVSVRRYNEGWPLGGGPYVQLGIHCEDGEARHDFRDLQKIKNEICGDEWEAVELYPAESRLLDPSNYFLLWCAPNIPIGMHKGRSIRNPNNCIAPQRAWANGDEPKE